MNANQHTEAVQKLETTEIYTHANGSGGVVSPLDRGTLHAFQSITRAASL